MRKLISIIVIAALVLTSFTACTGSGVREYTDPTDNPGSEAPDASTTPDENPGESGGSAEPETVDYTYAYEAYKPDTLVATINDKPVYWAEYFYWLHDAVSIISTYYGEINNWSEPCELDASVSYSEYVNKYALDAEIQYRAMETKAEELNITVTDEDREQFDSTWQDNIEYFGSEEELQKQLDSVFLNMDLYNYINEVSALYEHVFAELYGEQGEKLDEAEALSYANDMGYMRVKHILLSILDDEGNALSEEEVAQKLATTEDILNQLNAVADDPEALEAKVDELAAEYSEDSGLAAYPDGYCFSYGDMVEEFYEASVALGEYELSGIVESYYGYHIILRLPLRVDDIPMSNGVNTIGYLAALGMYDANIGSWIDEAKVEMAEGFENLDLSKVF